MIRLINWKEVQASNFEKFIYHSLGFEGFKKREWFGRGGSDRGRDVVATRYEDLPYGLGYERTWIFQCKKWRRMPNNLQIQTEIATAAQHHPDFWVMVVPLNPPANTIDYFKNLQRSYPFKIILMPLVAIEEILHKRPELRHVLEKGHLPEGNETDV